MTFYTKAQVKEILQNKPYGVDDREIIEGLISRGAQLEGLNEQKPEKSFWSKAADIAKAPVNLLVGGVEEGLGKVAQTVGNVTGIEAIKNAGNTLDSLNSKESLQQNLEDTGKFAKVALPVAAGIATAGASIPATLAASAAAGAAGSVVKDATDRVDQSGVDIAKNALKSGAVDAGIDAVTLGLGRALKPVAAGLKSRALANVGKALKPTTNTNKEIVERIAPEILNRPLKDTVAMTTQGMAIKAGAKKELVGEGFNDIVVQGRTKIKDIVKALDVEKGKFMAGGVVVDKNGLDAVEEVQRIFAQYGDEVDNSVLRTVRQIFDKAVQGKNGFNTTLKEGSEVSIKKTASDQIRGILARSNPDLAKLNKEYTFWKNLEDVATASAKRGVGQSDGLVENIAGLSGAASGQGAFDMITKGLAMKWAVKALSSPAARLTAAKGQNELARQIAENIATSNFGNVLRIITKTFPDLTDKIDKEALDLETELGI